MERGQVIIIAVVGAALTLFGLKVWSERAAESSLESASERAAQRLARAGGMRGDASTDSGSGSDAGGAPGRPGSMRPGSGFGGAPGMRDGGIGPDGRGGADVARGGGVRAGGRVLGSSGSARETGGTSGVGVIGGESGRLGGPKVQQRDSLVEFLGSQPPTQPDFASPENAEGEDVALKIDTVTDIDAQGGEGRNVEDAEDGDGIRINEKSDIQFPNNVSPEAATFSFKIQPDWSGGDQTDNALLQLRGQHEWSNRLELVKNGEFLRFILTDSTGQEADISYRITDWAAGEEHDVQAMYGNGETQLIVDGRVVGKNKYNDAEFIPPPGTPLRVGGDWPGSNYQPANAVIRDFTITNSASSGG